MLKDIYHPLSIFVAAFCAITSAVVLEENGIDWIYSVWVVMAVASLVDFDSKEAGRLVKLLKKVAAIAAGLVIGILSGLIVLGLSSWDAPSWSISFIRILVSTSIPFACAIIMNRPTVAQHLNSVHFALVCAFLAPPLFANSRSQALARLVAVLFACGVVAIVSVVAWFLRPRIYKRNVLADNAPLFDATVTLCLAAIQSAPDSREEFARQFGVVGSQIEEMVRTESFFGISILEKVSLDGIVSNWKPLVADAASLYWTNVATSNVACLRTTADKYAFFCETEAQFKMFFSSSIVKIENGLELVRVDFLRLLTGEGEGEEILLGRTVHGGVGFFIVEGIEELQRAFDSNHAVFSSEASKQAMSNYLVNLGAMLLSLIGLVKTVVDAVGLGDKLPHLSSELVDSMRRIAATQITVKNNLFEEETRENTDVLVV